MMLRLLLMKRWGRWTRRAGLGVARLRLRCWLAGILFSGDVQGLLEVSSVGAARYPLWNALTSINADAQRSPARALQQPKVCLVGLGLWDNPSLEREVLHVTQHLGVLFLLILLGDLPTVVDRVSGDCGVHDFPLLAHLVIEVEPWTVAKAVLRVFVVRRDLHDFPLSLDELNARVTLLKILLWLLREIVFLDLVFTVKDILLTLSRCLSLG